MNKFYEKNPELIPYPSENGYLGLAIKKIITENPDIKEKTVQSKEFRKVYERERTNLIMRNIPEYEDLPRRNKKLLAEAVVNFLNTNRQYWLNEETINIIAQLIYLQMIQLEDGAEIDPKSVNNPDFKEQVANTVLI